MRKKAKSKINSYTLMPNGIWIETNQKSVICWHKEDEYLLYSEAKKQSGQITTPFLRAYQYLYNQLIGKYFTYVKIKKENPQIINSTKGKYSIFQKLTVTKLLLTIVVIYYFTSLQMIIQYYIYTSFSSSIASIISISFEYLLLLLFLFLVFRLFVDSKDIKQISKYNSALKKKTIQLTRNDSVFMIVSILLSFLISSLINALIHIDSTVVVFAVYPIVYEILNLSESKTDRYSYFLLYSPVYFIDKLFTQKPTKKEQKCITLALKEII